MDIEVKHDPFNLPSKILLKVRSIDLARIKLERWLETKHASFRLRYIPDKSNSTLELGARNKMNMDQAIRLLRDCGQYVRVEPWYSKMISMARSRKMDTSFNVTLS